MMAPVVVALRLPPTVVVPKLKAPLVSVRLLPTLVPVPIVKALAPLLSVTALAPLFVSVTAPVKLLPALFNVMVLAPELNDEAPVMVNAPPWEMEPAVVVAERPPLPIFSACALNVPLFVDRLVSAVPPPTVPL